MEHGKAMIDHEMIDQFQIVGAFEVPDEAQAILESVGWDLQRAIEARLGVNTEEPEESNASSSGPERRRARTKIANRNDNSTADDDFVRHPWKVLTNDLDGSDAINDREDSVILAGPSRPIPARKLPQKPQKKKRGRPPIIQANGKTNSHAKCILSVGNNEGAEAEGVEEKEEETENNELCTTQSDDLVMQVEKEVLLSPTLYQLELVNHSQLQSERNDDRAPLIPTDCQSVNDALQNLSVVFASRYGPGSPNFHLGPLDEAMHDSFESISIPERRPLLIYLHDDNSVAGHLFAQLVSSEPVSSLVRNQFVTWAWDMTQDENRVKLFDWLRTLGARELLDIVKTVAKDRFPLLIVLSREKTMLIPVQVIQGVEDPQTVMNKLMHGLELYQEIKLTEIEDERQRIEREQMRQQQAAEYEKALEEDRAKQAETQKKLQKDRELERRKREEREREELKTLSKDQSFGDLKWPVREQITVEEI